MSAKTVVEKFGGQTALAKELGINQSAISYWVKKGAIPSKWHSRLFEIALASRIDLSASDFIDEQTQLAYQAGINGPASTDEVRFIASDEMTATANRADDVEASIDAVTATSPFMFYGAEKVQVMLGDETVWASQQGLADIFDTSKQLISYHLSNIFNELELYREATVKEILTVQTEGGRKAERKIEYYNLDAIISVGYRINSSKATQFRRWATSILKEYMIKGYALDDERLKQGGNLFGKEYFDELLERIRKIRTSERMFWQKVTDLYSQCSSDYDKSSPITQHFFASVQNKFHYAIHHHTAAELVKERADSSKPNMGLVHYANMNKDGVILKTDVPIGKNYLTPDELDELERLVENYLGSAELFAKRKILMTMKDWSQKLDEFLRFNAYDVLDGLGKVSSDAAKRHALSEYEKYTQIHEREFRSDFDKFVDDVKIKRRLPKPASPT